MFFIWYIYIYIDIHIYIHLYIYIYLYIQCSGKRWNYYSSDERFSGERWK
jgi:hypothetical protein